MGHRGRTERGDREGPRDHDARRRRRRRLSRRATSRATPTRSAPCSPPCTATSPPADRRPTPAYPTFADGHDAVVVCEAISESARTGTWATVERDESCDHDQPSRDRSDQADMKGARHEAGSAHRRLPRHTADRGRRLGGGQRVLHARGRLAGRDRTGRRAATPACRTSTAPTCPTARRRTSSAISPNAACRSPRSATTRTRCTPTSTTAPRSSSTSAT